MEYWNSYSKKCIQRIEYPHNGGILQEQWKMPCITACVKQEEIVLKLHFLIDETDGVVADAKFQLFGPSYLIAAADILCDLALRKNATQACQINLKLIEKTCGEFPSACKPQLQLLFRALEEIRTQCESKNFPKTVSTPIETLSQNTDYPDWHILSQEEKLDLIEKVIAEDIRPYIELDEGGIQVEKLVDDREVLIRYSGACTSCYSAVGSTLSAIQDILQSKVHPELVVVPNV